MTYPIREPALEEIPLSPQVNGIIEPTIKHEVVPQPGVRFYIKFYRPASKTIRQMPKPLKRLLWLLAGFTTLGLGFITYAYTLGIVPYTPDIAEFDLGRDFSPKARAAMEPILLGGHFFILDGQDIWMRFKAPAPDSDVYGELDTFIPDFSKFLPCDPDEQEIVRRWFLKRVSRPTPIAWITPWSELDPLDRTSLEATGQLECIYSADLTVSALSTPNSCSRWWLHSRKTGLVYVRWACYN